MAINVCTSVDKGLDNCFVLHCLSADGAALGNVRHSGQGAVPANPAHHDGRAAQALPAGNFTTLILLLYNTLLTATESCSNDKYYVP